MKRVSREFVRSKNAAGVLASLRVENLTPSLEIVSGLNAVSKGLTTTTELLKKVQLKYVTLRRV